MLTYCTHCTCANGMQLVYETHTSPTHTVTAYITCHCRCVQGCCVFCMHVWSSMLAVPVNSAFKHNHTLTHLCSLPLDTDTQSHIPPCMTGILCCILLPPLPLPPTHTHTHTHTHHTTHTHIHTHTHTIANHFRNSYQTLRNTGTHALSSFGEQQLRYGGHAVCLQPRTS